jgi:hypothetical protein
MTSKSVISVLAQIFFVAGLASVIYGIALWSKPLAFVIGGIAVATVAFLVGYWNLDLKRSRR